MRLIKISLCGFFAAAAACAGQIQIGAGSAGGVSTQGLTAAYVGANSWAEKNYVTNLFTTDTISNGSLNLVAGTAGNGTGSTLPTSLSGYQQFTDLNNGIVFGMISDTSTASNYWGSPASSPSTSSSITIPIGIFGLSDAYVLLNDYFGPSGIHDTNVVFNYAATGAITKQLTNGVEIDSAHNCGAPGVHCSAFSGTTTSPNTDIAWSGSYTEGVNTTPYTGTSGTLNLLDIHFNLSGLAPAGDTLTSITFTDLNNLTNSSRLALSAITFTNSPEPSTWLLLAAGLGFMVFLGQRRKARQ